jgi:hypothetical protein
VLLPVRRFRLLPLAVADIRNNPAACLLRIESRLLYCPPMKAISASIVVLAGAIVYAAGSLTGHGDTQVVTCLIGAVVLLIGLYGWFLACARKD